MCELAVVEAENENTPLAGGFWVLNLHVPGVGTKPCAANRPRPGDAKEPINPWQDNGGCCQVKRKSANTPETSHGPELKFQGVAIVTGAPTAYVCREAS